MADTNDNPTPERLAELERENARLRAELAAAEARLNSERKALQTYILDSLPKTDEEMVRLLADSRPAEEVFAELEREFGPIRRRESA